MSLYPVNLDIRGRLCLVVGGGAVASRKIEALLPCEPKILVISPAVCQRIADLAEKRCVDWKQREYKKGDLTGAMLAFAATNNRKTQEQVVAEADGAGILVNVITDPHACSFQVPALFRRDELLITVATGGGSPALAARIRKELEVLYGPEYGLLLLLMASVRQQIVSSSDVPAEHKLIFETLLKSDILAYIKAERWAQLESTLLDILPSEIEIPALIEKLQKREKTKMETLSC